MPRQSRETTEAAEMRYSAAYPMGREFSEKLGVGEWVSCLKLGGLGCP